MRSLKRQMKRHAERKEKALELYAASKGLQLSDCHPDVKTFFTLMYHTYEAHKFGDTLAVSNGLNAVGRLLEKYASQVEKEALTEEP